MRSKHPDRLRLLSKYPEASGAMGGIFLSMLFFAGCWGPLSALFKDSTVAARRLLSDSFAAPLAKALSSGDDLARIDELRRLQKVTGVAAAKVVQKAGPRMATPLIWEGKRLGYLDIQLSPVLAGTWRYRFLERAWTITLAMGVIGGLAGWMYRRACGRQLDRLILLLRRRRRRRQSHLHSLDARRVEKLADRTRQAMRLSPYGLILLDERQRMTAFNGAAEQMLRLTPEALGAHWLDLQPSPEWAAALHKSLAHPGQRVPAPLETSGEVSLLTFTAPANDSHCTWIILHGAAEEFLDRIRYTCPHEDSSLHEHPAP